MYRILTYLLIGVIIITSRAWGQNLVPNPSFEKYHDCRYQDTTYWSGPFKIYDKHERIFVSDWFHIENSGYYFRSKGFPISSWETMMGNVDYDNIKLFCRGEKNTFYENLYYEENFPQPISGDLMVHISQRLGDIQNQIDGVESIATNLNAPMEKDSIYHFNFFIRSPPYTWLTTDNFGWHFTYYKRDLNLWSDSIPNMRDPEYTVFQSSPGMFLGNMEEWAEFSTCYQAIGDEKVLYLSLNTAYGMDSFPKSNFFKNVMLQDSKDKTMNEAPTWTWTRQGNAYKKFIVFLDSITLEKVPYEPIIRDTLLFCTENSDWLLDSNSLKKQEVFNSVNLSYLWEDGETELYRSFSDTGRYILNVNSQCGAYTFIYDVHARQCQEYIYIPTAFTPNYDGVNDVFQPLGKNFTPVSFSIYDRYGARIFEGREGNLGWDGKHKGQNVSPGIYVYKFIYLNDTGEEKQMNGTVTVLK